MDVAGRRDVLMRCHEHEGQCLKPNLHLYYLFGFAVQQIHSISKCLQQIHNKSTTNWISGVWITVSGCITWWLRHYYTSYSEDSVLFHTNPNPNPKFNPITNLTRILTITSALNRFNLENTCHTWALLWWWFTAKRRYIKCTDLYL